MPELRKDYVTDTWVVFSAARAQRPGAFRGGKSTTDPDKCPFCYGHEHMTPPEVLAYRKDGVPNGPGWWIRCVPNKYPALQVEGEVHRRVSQLFHSVNGVGAHEIIVETPEHEHHLSMQSEFQVQEIITAYKQRYLDLIRDKRFKYILIFKNHGERAGASLDDPPFNYYIHTAPCDRKESKYHWHLEITPRLTETAGFERGTGFYINPVMPEDAAAILRERVKLSDKPH